MKSIIYKELLKREIMEEGNDIIVYSFILSKSITQIDCVWDVDSNSLDKECLNEMFEGEDNTLLDCYELNITKIAYEVGLSERTTKASIDRLKKQKLISKSGYGETLIWCNKNIINGGYFTYMPKGLTGNLAIIYQMLFDKGLKYDNSLNTWRNKLAEQLNVSVSTLDYYLTTLKKKNFIYRNKTNGKIIFLK